MKIKGVRVIEELARVRPDWTFWLAGGAVIDESGNICAGDDLLPIDTKLPNLIYKGVVKGDEKKILLAEATVLIQPTIYFEPCGLNVMEALFSGTPVIIPSFGGFLDFVIDGYNGCIVNPGEDYSPALDKAETLNPRDCRESALKLFSEERALAQYYTFIEKAISYDKTTSLSGEDLG